MPPRKRALAETDPNPRPAKSRSKKSNGSAETAAEKEMEPAPTSAPEDNESGKPQPLDYITIPRHLFDYENEQREQKDKEQDVDDEDERDEDEEEAIVYKRYATATKELEKQGVLFKPASEHPQHRWVAMDAAWAAFRSLSRHASYTDPDSFGMYIYNDFHGYGLQEVIENHLLELDSAFKKRNKGEDDVKAMWAQTAALGHWLATEQLQAWCMSDDGERFNACVKLIGAAVVNALNELHLAGMLQAAAAAAAADSPIRDLALVMSLYLKWGESMASIAHPEAVGKWAATIAAFSKLAGVDLLQGPCSGVGAIFDALLGDDETYDTVPALVGAAKADRWGWKKQLAAFKKMHGKLGGKQYNIMLFSRAERKRYAFDGKDPLAQFTDAQLRSGELELA